MSTTSVTPIFDELVQLLGLELDLDHHDESPADSVEDAGADVDMVAAE